MAPTGNEIFDQRGNPRPYLAATVQPEGFTLKVPSLCHAEEGG